MKLSFSTIRELFLNTRKGIPKINPEILNVDNSVYLHQILDEYLLNEKSFLRRRYSIQDLAQETGIAMHQLSAFLNKERGMNFNDFINQYRIHYCLQFLQASVIKKMNLFELAGICGFSNRNTFTCSFKKVTGETPSAFIRKLKGQSIVEADIAVAG